MSMPMFGDFADDGNADGHDVNTILAVAALI